jgi:hypothetical protein
MRGAIGLVVIAAGVAIVFLTGSRTRTAHRRAVGPAFYLYSGMSKAQVLRAVGQPTTRRGVCWLYDHTHERARGGQLTAFTVCFYAAHVSDLNYQINGKWEPPARPRLPAPVNGSS